MCMYICVYTIYHRQSQAITIQESCSIFDSINNYGINVPSYKIIILPFQRVTFCSNKLLQMWKICQNILLERATNNHLSSFPDVILRKFNITNNEKLWCENFLQYKGRFELAFVQHSDTSECFNLYDWIQSAKKGGTWDNVCKIINIFFPSCQIIK